MLTGPRRGEISALRWRHVDFDRAVLWVEGSNTQTRDGIREKSTKKSHNRRIALDPGTVELLRTHNELWTRRCDALGCELSLDAFVFSTAPDGATPYPPRAISQRYRRIATRLQLRSKRLHSLRHYSATELVAARVDIRTVAGRLGHGSGGATTLKVYAAWVEDADRRAATTMSSVVPKPDPRRPARPYEIIAASLREQITGGTLKPGDQLPTIVQVATAHAASVGTAHRAVSLLEEEGLIEVTRGSRATVAAGAQLR